MSTNLDFDAPPGDILRRAAPVPARRSAILPTVVTRPGPKPKRRSVVLGLIAIVIAAGAIFGWYAWQNSSPALPAGIAFGNGRLEADEIDIASKFSGRIAALLADEGDTVRAGQVVARMDTRDLEASLRKAEAQVLGATRMLEEARGAVVQEEAQANLAAEELNRASFLFQKGYATAQTLDQRRQEDAVAKAALGIANARVGEIEQTLAATTHDVDLYQVNIADNTLTAARDGRIQYRLANIGEVLAAGGKVFTMLDTGYVYMDVFLPTAEAGRTLVGGDARIVLDAMPTTAIPAKVVFIADQAQFTPKTVETKAERDKLMFRVRVRVEPAFLSAHSAEIRSGMPGLAYVRFDPKVDWPASLQASEAGVQAR
jgi:HlyD family secretion protein